jgi:hypothetical protein
MRFVGNDNLPLVGGMLYTYAAGTSTPQATYTDSTGSFVNTNPVIANSRGEANIWFTPGQSYKVILTDSLGNTIWTVDNIIANGSSTGAVNGLTSVTGTNTITAISSGITVLAAGQMFSGVAANTNTGATTININSLGAVSITNNGNALVGGELIATIPFLLYFDGTKCHLMGGTQYIQSANIACAATLNLSRGTITGDYLHVTTGVNTVTAITMQKGEEVTVVWDVAAILTNGASLILPGAANIQLSVGDVTVFRGEASGVVRLISYTSVLGTPLIADQIQPITASVGSNAMTVTLNNTSLEFRNGSLTSGAVSQFKITTPISVVIPSSATLGTVNAILSRIAVIAMNNSGTIELAVVNTAGGVNLDETTLISTTAISAAATSATVVYSTSSRGSLSFRIVGYIESTQATAGTWATAPSLIQGAGGLSVSGWNSLGNGQNWNAVTRVSGTTYYNTTNKPIFVCAGTSSSGTLTIFVNGIQTATSAGGAGTYYAIVPPGNSYVITSTVALSFVSELR